MLLRFLPCLLVINLSFIRGCTRTITTNLCFFLVYQVNIFPFNFCFVNYSVVFKSKAKAVEHTNKRDTGHQNVALDNKTGDSTMLKMGDSAKFVIKQDMKGRRHKYGLNNNEREKAQKKRVVDDEIADKHQLDEIMGSPPASTTPPPPPPSPPSPPSPPPPPPTSDASASTSAVKRTRKASRLRSLSTRPPGVERPVVHVDPATRKADGPHKKKLRTYLGIVTRDKVDITYENWKEVPTAQKDLIWEDIQTVGERWRQFKSDLTRKWALAADQDSVEDTVCDKYGISKEKWAQFCQTRKDPSWEDVRMKAQAIQKQNTAPHVLSRGGYDYLEQKLLAEKTKKKMQETAQSGSVDGVIDPPSPVRHHVKWKMARTKKTGEMTTEAAKEIAEKIDSFEEQATQGSFVPHGRQDVLAAAIGRPEHPGRVRGIGAGLTQQIRDQLEESITEKVMRQVMASFSHLQSQMQSQGFAVPPEPLVGPGPSGPRVSTKGSCVDPSGNDPETGDSERCDLYIEADPARLVSIGRVYEGSSVVHNTPLLLGQVKVSVEEVRDADASVPVPTDEVSLVGQALHTFLAWPTHLVKSLSQQVTVSPPKPPPKPDPEVDDPLYLMTLTIPKLFLRPYQVRWDATVFGVVNPDFSLYIKHEDLSEIAHGGQCLSISVLQLWILHLTETCMRAGNSYIYGFLEPQSIQRSGQSQFESESYIKSWMHSSQRDVYLGAYLNGPDNYLKGIINRVLMMLHSLNQRLLLGGLSSRQKGTTECSYYVMHWMSTIILGSFRNNWEAYFNDPRPLEPERLKALRIQWAQFYLRSKFELTCNDSSKKLLWANLEVSNINVTSHQMVVSFFVSEFCSKEKAFNKPWIKTGRFSISRKENKFLTVGCDSYGYLNSYFDGDLYSTGCLTRCYGNNNLIDNETCWGIGCCQVDIPPLMRNITVEASSFVQSGTDSSGVNASSTTFFNSTCSYSFVVRNGFYKFSTTHLQSFPNKTLPMVIDWTAGDKSCKDSMGRGDYACKANSYCDDGDTDYGYRCRCKDGYEGNSYLGCTEILECTTRRHNCSSEDYCREVRGSFECFCPDGLIGNGTIEGGGCQPKQRYNVFTKVAIGVGLLGLFMGTSWLYLIYQKRKVLKLKEKFFQQNGGMILKQQLSAREDSTQSATIFTAEQLKKATNNFDESLIIGKGGYGTVFKGVLSNNTIVAIKKSKTVDQSQVEQFINEVIVLSQINHRNVVKLLGCCLETEVPLLVYEFVSNGTLFHYLHNEGQLANVCWKTRLRIATEAAGALSYLHSEASIPIIHRDVKTANILLDDACTAKVSDFGASRLIPLDQTELATIVQGTIGYLDPEYMQTSQLTEKSDVYSFGVVLVELLTGEKPFSFDKPEDKRSLTVHFLCCLKEDRLFDVLQIGIYDEENKQEIMEVAILAAKCLRLRGEERPGMKEVAMELEGIRLMEKQPRTNAGQNFEETQYLLHGAYSTHENGDSSGQQNTGFDSLRDIELIDFGDGR
ncbi:Wall-associated receptor kinase 2 [Glycine soja]